MIAPVYYHCPTCDEPYDCEEMAAWCCEDRRQDFQTRDLVDGLIYALKEAVRERQIPEGLTFPPKSETPGRHRGSQTNTASDGDHRHDGRND